MGKPSIVEFDLLALWHARCAILVPGANVTIWNLIDAVGQAAAFISADKRKLSLHLGLSVSFDKGVNNLSITTVVKTPL
ncbi:MAG: hypothetical protein R8K48_02845 [Gallionella sp.]